MRRNDGRKVLLLIATLVTSLLMAATRQAGTLANEEEVIRQNVKQMEDGWNRKSGDLFAKPFAEDADYVVINGMRIKGRKVIAQAHQRIFDTMFKNTSLSLKVEQIRLLRPDVALVHVSGYTETPQAQGTSRIDAIITLVMTKTGGVWQIAAFQNTRIEARQ